MSGPPTGCQECIVWTDRNHGVAIEAIKQFNSFEEMLQARKRPEIVSPGHRAEITFIGHDQTHSKSTFGEFTTELKDGDVSAEDVFEINNRHKDIDAAR